MTKILGKLYEVCSIYIQLKMCDKQLHKDYAEVELFIRVYLEVLAGLITNYFFGTFSLSKS